MSILDELEPPERKDFRRVGKQVPMVLVDGKWERFRRPSSAGKILDDEANLVDWQKRTIVYGAAQRPDLMAEVSVLDFERDKKPIRDIVEECLVSGKGTQAANKGTAIHKMLDRIDRGDEWTPAPNYVAACDSYVDAMAGYGLIPIDVEVHCVNVRYRMAGTMDRRYRTTRTLVTPYGEIVPIGSIIAGDTKTGRTLEYAAGSYATQIAAYVGSDFYDVDNNEMRPFDPPTYQPWALIVHVVADEARTDLYWVDMEAGREALELAEHVRNWRKRTDLLTPSRAPLHAVADPPADPLPTTADPAAGSKARHPSNVPGEPPMLASTASDASDEADMAAKVRDWLRGRVAAVRAAGDDATKALQRAWPVGVPGLKFDTQTMAQLDDINDAIWKVDAQYGIGFGDSDPRTPPLRDFASRWAEPTGDDMPDDLQAHENFRNVIDKHPRRKMLAAWSVRAQANQSPDIRDRWALLHALKEFAMLGDEYSDDDVTELLDGTLRAIGYEHGVNELGFVVAQDAPLIMSSAFAIMAGTALLLFNDDGLPVVRTIK